MEETGEHYRPQGELLHPGICEAYGQIDRESIRLHAELLIAGRSEVVPKTHLEYADNARTAIWEALSASGHHSRVEITGTPEEISAQVVNRLLHGMRDDLPPHEYRRRFAELCNVLVIGEIERRVVSGESPATTAVLECSDFASALLDPGQHGYREDNLKGAVRSTSWIKHADGTVTRVLEQVSRSNSTDGSTFRFFEAAGVQPELGRAPDLVALDTPLLYSSENYPGLVVDIQHRLDYHASLIAGQDVWYGDTQAERSDHVPYEALAEESARRESMVAFYEAGLADYEARLDVVYQKGVITFEQKTAQYNQLLLTTLRAICARAPQYATDCFGEAAAGHYYEASNLLAMGRDDEALRVIEQGRHLEKPVIICGGMLSDEQVRELGLSPSGAAALVELGKENWKTSVGVCRIKNCPSPKPTEVGPCQVCMDRCQKKFDKGETPNYGSDQESILQLAEKILKPQPLQGLGELAITEPTEDATPRRTDPVPAT